MNQREFEKEIGFEIDELRDYFSALAWSIQNASSNRCTVAQMQEVWRDFEDKFWEISNQISFRHFKEKEKSK
jgi:hypothetical protein